MSKTVLLFDVDGTLVTTGGAGMASHWTLVSAGTPMITGAVVSTTVMIWLWLLTLPQASVPVQARVRV